MQFLTVLLFCSAAVVVFAIISVTNLTVHQLCELVVFLLLKQLRNSWEKLHHFISLVLCNVFWFFFCVFLAWLILFTWFDGTNYAPHTLYYNNINIKMMIFANGRHTLVCQCTRICTNNITFIIIRYWVNLQHNNIVFFVWCFKLDYWNRWHIC